LAWCGDVSSAVSRDQVPPSLNQSRAYARLDSRGRLSLHEPALKHHPTYRPSYLRETAVEPIISAATDWSRLREGSRAVRARSSEWSSEDQWRCRVGCWFGVSWSLSRPAACSEFFRHGVKAASAEAFVTGASLLAGARNYCLRSQW